MIFNLIQNIFSNLKTPPKPNLPSAPSLICFEKAKPGMILILETDKYHRLSYEGGRGIAVRSPPRIVTVLEIVKAGKKRGFHNSHQKEILLKVRDNQGFRYNLWGNKNKSVHCQ